jgi:hypothetical protein
MIITNKIKEAFPILNSIDDSLLVTIPISCYCIVNKNNQFSIRVSAMNEYVPRIFESLNKPIPYDLKNSLDLSERLIIDLNSIENDNLEVHIDIPNYYSYGMEKFPFNINTEYNYESKINDEGHHPLSLKFDSLNLIGYSHFLSEESKMREYRFSADTNLIDSVDVHYVMEPSNEELVRFHSVFEGFERDETITNIVLVNSPIESYVMVMNITTE